MVFEYLRVLEKLRPRVFLLENVKGLLSKRFAPVFADLLSNLGGARVPRLLESFEQLALWCSTTPRTSHNCRGARRELHVSQASAAQVDFGRCGVRPPCPRRPCTRDRTRYSKERAQGQSGVARAPKIRQHLLPRFRAHFAHLHRVSASQKSVT